MSETLAGAKRAFVNQTMPECVIAHTIVTIMKETLGTEY